MLFPSAHVRCVFAFLRLCSPCVERRLPAIPFARVMCPFLGFQLVASGGIERLDRGSEGLRQLNM